MVGMVEQYLVQAPPIEYFPAFGALCKVLLFLQAAAFRIRRVSSELSICFVESDRAFKFAVRIQNTNFT
jgi:hypothetical protein